MKKLRRYKVLIILGIIVLVLLGIFGLSKKLIKSSYSSAQYIKEKTEKENEDLKVVEIDTEELSTEDIEEDFVRVPVEGSSSGGFEKVSQLYNPEGVSTRQKNFLGDNYGKFEKVFEDLNINCSEYVAEIPSHQNLKVETTMKYSGETFSLSELEEYDYVIFNEVMTIIGLYNNTSILFAYNYPYTDDTVLVFVDYSDTRFSTEYYTVWDIGEVKSVGVDTRDIVVKEIGGYTVIFVKG